MKHFLLLLLAAALLGGCAKRETQAERGIREQILHLANGSEPQDLDPHITTGVPEFHIQMSLFEGLTAEHPKDLSPVPGVAERWDISPDGSVYTFHLRANAKWSNGERITAHDFLKSYRRILTASLASEYAYMLYVVKGAEQFNKGKLASFDEVGVKAMDDATLQITLNGPTPYFLSLLSHHSWFPVHLPTVEKHGKAYERGNRWTRPENFVGNGSFTLAEWKMNQVIAVKKSPTYWDTATVRLNGIRYYPMESDDTDERAFRSGQTHLCYAVPLSKIASYKQDNPDVLHIDPFLTVYMYMLNVSKPPLTDKRVRRALALAIDRESIVKNVTKGGQLPALHFTPPGTAGYHARARLAPDLDAARKLLAEAGFPDGKGLPPVEILFNTLESHRTIAEAIQQMWKKNLGVDARLVNQEWKVYLDSTKSGNFQVARYAWTGDYMDPNSFLDMWVTGGGNNRTGWSNAEYDRLLQEAGRTTDPQARFEVFQKAEALLMEELPIIPIYFYTRVYLLHPAVKGWHPTLLDNHPFKHVYLEAPKK